MGESFRVELGPGVELLLRECLDPCGACLLRVQDGVEDLTGCQPGACSEGLETRLPRWRDAKPLMAARSSSMQGMALQARQPMS